MADLSGRVLAEMAAPPTPAIQARKHVCELSSLFLSSPHRHSDLLIFCIRGSMYKAQLRKFYRQVRKTDRSYFSI